MDLMTSTASVAHYYDTLVHTWQDNQRFTKKVSDVSARHRKAESLLDELSVDFTSALDKVKSGVNWKSSVANLVNVLRETNKTMSQAIPGLQACIRAQKARRLSKIRASLQIESNSNVELQQNAENESVDFADLDEPDYFLSLSSFEKARSENIKLKVLNESTCKFQVNKCRICLRMFHNRYQLIKHQNTHGHKLKRGRPSSTNDDI